MRKPRIMRIPREGTLHRPRIMRQQRPHTMKHLTEHHNAQWRWQRKMRLVDEPIVRKVA